MPSARTFALLNELKEKIAAEIKAGGPISFERFMTLALYEPQYGYYCSTREKLGFSGDFYTSCTLTPAFGYCIARQLLEMFESMGEEELSIVEYGAGTGELCQSILSYIKANAPAVKVKYYIIEISGSLRGKQRQKLGSAVEWVDQISVLSPFKGIVLSNELVDNLSFHRVRMKAGLQQCFVDYRNEQFVELWEPASPALKNYFENMRVSLPEGYYAEACLSAGDWVSNIALSLEKGFVMTIDYGYLSGELYAESRRDGTAVGYKNHKVTHDLYHEPGTQDISAHVNFSALALFGRDNGLQLTGFRDQAPFLRSLGIEKLIAEVEGSKDSARSALRQNTVLETLLGQMGSKFKVLVMHKGLPQLSLRGFSQQSR